MTEVEEGGTEEEEGEDESVEAWERGRVRIAHPGLDTPRHHLESLQRALRGSFESNDVVAGKRSRETFLDLETRL